MEASFVARCACLGLLLEVSAYPKPGNVSRVHDFPGTSYEHFLASAVAVYPVLEEAAASGGRGGVGSFILRAVRESVSWQMGGNTHFGAFALIFPLVIAGGRVKELKELEKGVLGVVRSAGVEDAVDFYRAFSLGRVRVQPASGDFDLRASSSVKALRERRVGLFSLMEAAASRDLIAREWVEGFPRSFNAADSIREKTGEMGIKDAVVMAFMEQLAREPDTFIETKSGVEAALEVCREAEVVLNVLQQEGVSGSDSRQRLVEFDTRLLNRGLNPGSTADIISAGIFIALLGGMRF